MIDFGHKDEAGAIVRFPATCALSGARLTKTATVRVSIPGSRYFYGLAAQMVVHLTDEARAAIEAQAPDRRPADIEPIPADAPDEAEPFGFEDDEERLSDD